MARCKPGCQCRRHAGHKQSLETRAKLSLRAKGRKPSRLTRDKISAALTGSRHTPEHNANISAALRGNQYALGYKHTAETLATMAGKQHALGHKQTTGHRNKLSAAQRKHGETSLPTCRCVVHRPAPLRGTSKLSATMIDMYLSDFPEVIAEKQFGRYRVDAYLPPPYHMAFEADGFYWHNLHEQEDPGYYQRQDEYLWRSFNLPVVRLTEAEINETVHV